MSQMVNHCKLVKVVSFDAEWKEIYVGVARKDIFTAECPNNVPDAERVTVKYQSKDKENAIISSAKWCPMENCTLLVLASQYGVQIFDWDGSNLVYDFDFEEKGIQGDERQVNSENDFAWFFFLYLDNWSNGSGYCSFRKFIYRGRTSHW